MSINRHLNNVNIKTVVRSGLCLHCGTCIAACPQSCIEITLNKHDDLIPTIGIDCTNCGLCVEVCPGLGMESICKSDENDTDSLGLGNLRGAYIARALRPILKARRVASGGFISAIATAFFDEHPNGLVQWTSLSKEGIIHSHTQLLDAIAFREVDGDSIYIPSFANAAFREIQEDGKPILAIGLPCQIHGLHLLKKARPHLVKQIYCSISLFCGLTISTNGIAFLIKQCGYNMSEVSELRFRSGTGMIAILKDGQFLHMNKNRVNWSHMCTRCVLCPDHTGELADISCGDAWLPFFTSKSRLSWSIVIARSERGMSILRRTVQRGYLWTMRTGAIDVARSQEAMLYFKKRSLSQRLMLNRLFGGMNPRYSGFSLTKSLSPPVLFGNLFLLIHLRLRCFESYMKIFSRPFVLAIFNKVIRICLYTDLKSHLQRMSVRGLLLRMNNTSSILRVGYMWARLKRFGLSRIFHSNNIASGFNFSDDLLEYWRDQYPQPVIDLLSHAKQYKNGKVQIFNRIYDLTKYGWNCSLATHRHYPDLPYLMMAQHYNLFDKFGDVKDVFELHKHYGFVELALAYRFTHDNEYLKALLYYLKSWCSSFYPNIGIGWCGNVHVAQRMIALIFVYMLLLDGSSSIEVSIQSDILKSLREHAFLLRRRYQQPPNNHKLGSLCSLIIYEWLKCRNTSSHRQRQYLQELTDAVLEQTSTDGAPGEGSLAYGRLVLEFLLLLQMVAVSLECDLPQPLIDRIRAMVTWFGKILGPEDSFPPLGDDSGERAFPFNNYLADGCDCLSIGQALFSQPSSAKFTPIASLLLRCPQVCSSSTGGGFQPFSSFVDQKSGYGRVSRICGADRWTVWIRSRAFGLPPNFGHSHSDYLAPVIFLNGHPVLTEAGTFRYSIATEDRLSDVLTQGHSGIRYEMFEQNTWRGTFTWSGKPLVASLDDTKNGLIGRVTMPDHSVLKRTIIVGQTELDICDELHIASKDEKLLEWNFIVNGVLEDGFLEGQDVIVFRLLEMNRYLRLIRRGGWMGMCELLPVRIATRYGVSHEGCRFVIRSLARGGSSWTTRLSIV